MVCLHIAYTYGRTASNVCLIRYNQDGAQDNDYNPFESSEAYDLKREKELKEKHLKRISAARRQLNEDQVSECDCKHKADGVIGPMGDQSYADQWSCSPCLRR